MKVVRQISLLTWIVKLHQSKYPKLSYTLNYLLLDFIQLNITINLILTA